MCVQHSPDDSYLPCLHRKTSVMTMLSPKKGGGQVFTNISSIVSSCARAVCKFFVDEFLARGISCGSLTLVFPDSEEIIFGEHESDARKACRPTARLYIQDPASFYARIGTSADIGFAEAFMAGDFTVEEPEHLTDVFLVLILNRDNNKKLSPSSLLISHLGTRLNGFLHMRNRNTVAGSERNIEAHYDLSNELFATFLGDSWTYSCAYFGRGVKDLDSAQHAKIDKILDKAHIGAECHVLDIGCGWGELAIRAVQRFGCRVTGITLSREQLSLANKRAMAAGVSKRVSFELIDYRILAERGAKFDRIISVEMMEAIGHEFLGKYFAAVQQMLNKEGLVVVQVITTPEQRYEEYRRGTDFIQKHIFPGGMCPSFEAVVGAVAKNCMLVVEEVENIGPHYATTLKEWRRRFMESVEKGDVQKAGFDEVFVRKWIFYFSYCEAGFATRTLGDLQIVLTKGNNTTTLGGAPTLEAYE